MKKKLMMLSFASLFSLSALVATKFDDLRMEQRKAEIDQRPVHMQKELDVIKNSLEECMRRRLDPRGHWSRLCSEIYYYSLGRRAGGLSGQARKLHENPRT